MPSTEVVEVAIDAVVFSIPELLLADSRGGLYVRMPELDLTGNRVTSLGVVSVVVASANWEDLNISSYFVGSITSTSASPTTGIAAPRPSTEEFSMKLAIGLMKGSLSSSSKSSLGGGVVERLVVLLEE